MIKRILKIICSSILGIGVLTLLFIWSQSHGCAMPVRNAQGDKIAGSISSIDKIEMEEVEQYVIIRGEDATKPILLLVHGGPGVPIFSMLRDKGLHLEKEFVVAYWEQRGAGKSYATDIPTETMNLSQFITDTKVVSQYLKTRFKQEKIYIMGHSWGAFLGIQAAHQFPELYHAYIGIGQPINTIKGEHLSFAWVKQQAEERNDTAAIRILSNLVFPDSSATPRTWMEFLNIQRDYVNLYGGGQLRPRIDTWNDLAIPMFKTKEYTIRDKYYFVDAIDYSVEHLVDAILELDLNTTIDSMAVPAYFIQGKYDYMTPHTLVDSFYTKLKAPKKQLYSFENAAHSPFLDEKNKFNNVIKEIVTFR